MAVSKSGFLMERLFENRTLHLLRRLHFSLGLREVRIFVALLLPRRAESRRKACLRLQLLLFRW